MRFSARIEHRFPRAGASLEVVSLAGAVAVAIVASRATHRACVRRLLDDGIRLAHAIAGQVEVTGISIQAPAFAELPRVREGAIRHVHCAGPFGLNRAGDRPISSARSEPEAVDRSVATVVPAETAAADAGAPVRVTAGWTGLSGLLISLVILGFGLRAYQRMRRGATASPGAAAEIDDQRRRLLDRLPDGVFIHQGGRFVYANPTFVRLLGGDDGDRLIGREILERIHSDDHDAARQRMESVYAHRDIASPMELRLLRFDGTVVATEIADCAVEFDGAPAIQVVVKDISAWKRAAEELRESQRRYEAVARATTDAIWDWNLITNRVWWNEAARQRFGVPPNGGETDITWWYERIHADDRERVVVGIHRLIDSGKPRWSDQYRYLRPDGSWANVLDQGLVLHDDEGRAVRMIGAMVDITDRLAAEDRARRHQEQLAHVARLSTMGEMAAALAHELNQPLTAIVNFTDGALRRLGTHADATGEVLDALRGAGAQAHRAAEIIRRLRSLMQKREPQRSPLNLNDAVREAADLIEADARHHGVRFRVELAARLPNVMADNIQIQQVVLNLARNAVEAMEQTERRQRELLITTRAVGPRAVHVLVRDRGPGVSAEMLDHVFAPFHTTKRDGMGLGLAISQSIIEAHGGQLRATPNADQGMTFEFSLPVASGDPNHGQAADCLRC